jgi:hypothetical protein
MNAAVATIGTVKVGRWTYPARIEPAAPDKVARNTQRDGSGEWQYVDEKVAKTFIADEPFEYEAPEGVEPKALTGVVSPSEEYTADPEDASDDYKLARQILARTWGMFIWGSADEIRPAEVTEKRANEVLAALGKTGFVVREKADKNTGFKAGTPIYCATPNVDEAALPDLLAQFDAAVPHDLTIKARAAAHPVTNNTHKKPGRSTWQVGTPCPQGHTLEEGDVYVMPSGRKQCKKCRAGYPSNI